MSTALEDDEMYCRDCGEVINRRAEICPECGIRQREPETSKSEKNPGLAAVASFLVPGLGQVYNGEIAKGIIAGVITVLLFISVIGIIIGIPIWIWLVYDAYKTAERGGKSTSSNGNTPDSPRTWIENSLTWYADRADDPKRAEAVKKRFRGSRTKELPEEDKSFILNAVEEYDRVNGSNRYESISKALGTWNQRA